MFLLTATFAIAGLPAYADLVTSVTCHPPSDGYIQSATSCGVQAGGQTVSVSVEGSYYMPVSPGAFTALVGGRANAQPGVGANAGYAEGDVDFSFLLYTLGPARLGQAQVQLLFRNNGTGNFAYDNSASIGPYARTCYESTCSYSETIPLTLGVPFRVSLLDSLTAFGNPQPAGSQINVDLALSLAVFDANGTPVQLYAAPEPTWLVIPGLAVVAWRTLRRWVLGHSPKPL